MLINREENYSPLLLYLDVGTLEQFIMSTFEILIVVILGVYTLGSLYFAITGRIQNNRMKKQRDIERKEDLERADKSLQWEEQLKVLTKRIGEISTDNQRLADANRQWQAAYSEIYRELEAYKKKYEPNTPVQDISDIEEHQSPCGGHMNVSDKMDMEKQFGEEQ